MKIYLVKVMYQDQYSSVDAVCGVYTDLEKARTHRDSIAGYGAIFEAEADKPLPDKLQRVE